MICCTCPSILTHLQRKAPQLFARIFHDTEAELVRWNDCLLRAQKSLIEGNLFLEPGFQIKQNCHVRFVNVPVSPAELRKTAYPNNESVGQFLQVKGSVIRMTSSRFLEYKREYACTRCKQKVLIEAEYSKSYVFEPPGPCPNAREAGCRGQLQPVSAQPQPELCRDYQEIRIQEIMSERNVPASLVVTLEDDLVDSCQPGDCVTVCGRIEHRWKPPVVGRRTEVTIAMRANSVTKEESKASWAKDLPEHLLCVQAEWQEVLREIGELAARDLLVQSIAPAIRGMYPVKLAIALALASCTERIVEGDQQATVRGHSHLLLVGDPGLAKSQLLKFASEIASRAVYTTGMGCSSAGLTAAAVKDEGEWQLEAGALVLADGGICCIDEFNLMRETDKASIHEAMEQQTISVAKAGMVCKLSTRCVVLAATNPKNLYTMSDGEGTSAANIGIGGPLLSRFDMVMILRDIRAPDWDADIANHLLALALLDEDRECFEGANGNRSERIAHWELEKLQLHFAAIKDIHPTVSHEANLILGAYYKACRSDPYRDPTRTTVRLLDSLFRLAQAHARLLFRSEVTPIDAITIIQLMEASWGFGKIGIPIYNLIKAPLPLGPEQSFIDRLLNLLNLHDAVQDTATVRPIDATILRRYHREMIEKQRRKQMEKQHQANPEGGRMGYDPEARTQQTIMSTLTTVDEFQEQQKTSSVSPPAPTHSKYALNIRANLKKLRKPTTTDPATEESNPRGAKKRKRPANEVDEDPTLKAPLDEAAVGNLLGSLRKHFVESEPETLSPQASVQTASQTQSKDASFSALLDTSQIFDDDDDDEDPTSRSSLAPLEKQVVPEALTKVVRSKDTSSGGQSSVTPTRKARNESFSALLEDGANNSRLLNEDIEFDDELNLALENGASAEKVCAPLADTIPNTIANTGCSSGISSQPEVDTSAERSVYQIKRSTQRRQPTSSQRSTGTQLPTEPDTDDLLNFEIEPSGEFPLLSGSAGDEPTPSYRPGLRTQTRQKLHQFEFQPKRPVDAAARLEEDDSAYDSMLRDRTVRKEGQATQGLEIAATTTATTTTSQYSGLADEDVELNLSDIEL
ncbi:DNA helicase MCM9-like isoform X2 [Anopheles stephensi]|uniref:DNA helicase MCM9-like isoform X2 n=1 Tax=Anopheles stephensi TaxID=30069 RepID=UPI0016589127|nr:DNA helicase MCM9-like isoform X2 [Anopheles stephensi]